MSSCHPIPVLVGLLHGHVRVRLQLGGAPEVHALPTCQADVDPVWHSRGVS